jgi:hypothetical protein
MILNRGAWAIGYFVCRAAFINSLFGNSSAAMAKKQDGYHQQQ